MSQDAVSTEAILPEAYERLGAHAKAIGEMLFGVPGVSYAAGDFARSAEFKVKPLAFSPAVNFEAHKAYASLKIFLLRLTPDASLNPPHGQMTFQGAAVEPHNRFHENFAALVAAIKTSRENWSGRANGADYDRVQAEVLNEGKLMAEVSRLAGTMDMFFPVQAHERDVTDNTEADTTEAAVAPAAALEPRVSATAEPVPYTRFSRGGGADTYWRARAAAIVAALLLIMLTPDRLTNGGHGFSAGGRGFATADVMPEVFARSAVCPDDASEPCAVVAQLPDTVAVIERPLPYEQLFDFDPRLITIAEPPQDTLRENFCCLSANAGCIRNLEMFKEVVAATAAHVTQIKNGKMWLGRLNDQTLSEENLATALKEVSHFFFYTAKQPNPEMALKAATLAGLLVPNEPVFAMRAAKVMEHAGDMYLRFGYEAHALDYIERALDILERVPQSADKRSLYKRLYSMAAMTNVIDAGTNEPDERAIVRGEYACGINRLMP
ncbi:MAG: hypothetical protein EBQ96_03405 [Proteobacteria bacterium]|nr:hypothetical protein [Pseudomonadota bacterium]